MTWKKTLIGLPLLALGASCQLPQHGEANCACALHLQERENLEQQGVAQQQEAEDEKLVVHIVALKYGRSNQVAGMVQQLLSRRGNELRLVSDDRTNSVIVSGHLEEVEASKALILALDTPDATQQ